MPLFEFAIRSVLSEHDLEQPAGRVAALRAAAPVVAQIRFTLDDNEYTYRAAAVDQLEVWSKRVDVPIITAQPDSDPGAVTYDGIKSAISRGSDVVLIDTAGRLHTRYNLMEEIKKVYRVAEKALPGAPHYSWIVIDTTTGQNALNQAEAFGKAVNLNGAILAKLDTSAKGGMVFAIKDQLNIPVIYAGLGEKIEDLQLFDKTSFIDSIFTKNEGN